MKTLLAAAALSLAFAASADAATWQQVTPSGGANIDEVSARPHGGRRAARGVARRTATSSTRRSRANGKVGATTPIQTGWATTSDPAIVAVPGGLRAFWGGIRTTEPTETNTDFNTAFSPDGGASWQLHARLDRPARRAGLRQRRERRRRCPDGNTLQTFSGTLGTWAHAGLDPAVAELQLPDRRQLRL